MDQSDSTMLQAELKAARSSQCAEQVALRASHNSPPLRCVVDAHCSQIAGCVDMFRV